MKIKNKMAVVISAGLIIGTSLCVTGSVCTGIDYIETKNQIKMAENVTEGNGSLGGDKGFQDGNGNGIPDLWEDKWADSTFYAFTGWTLGAVVNCIMNVIYFFYIQSCQRKARKSVEQIAKDATTTVDTFKVNVEKNATDAQTAIEKYKLLADDMMKRNTTMLERINVLSETNDKLAAENKNLATNYHKLNAKMNSILENQVLAAGKCEETVRNGNAEKISEITKGALSHGNE